MSTCTIKGCTNKAVANGLCAKHYMRQRRRGDPEAAFPPGRQPKPRPEAPEAAALKREVATLREENATLKRQLEEAQAPPATAPSEWTRVLSGKIRKLVEENAALNKQLAAARAANPSGGPAEEAAALRLTRENNRLKEANAKLEAKLADDPGEVGKLEKQLKGAKTRNQNLQRECNILAKAARAKATAMSKADRRKIRVALHPDNETDPARKKRLEEALQTFEALPIRDL